MMMMIQPLRWGGGEGGGIPKTFILTKGREVPEEINLKYFGLFRHGLFSFLWRDLICFHKGKMSWIKKVLNSYLSKISGEIVFFFRGYRYHLRMVQVVAPERERPSTRRTVHLSPSNNGCSIQSRVESKFLNWNRERLPQLLHRLVAEVTNHVY